MRRRRFRQERQIRRLLRRENRQVYNVKGEWDIVQTFESKSKKGNICVQFLKDAGGVVVGGGDHNLASFQ